MTELLLELYSEEIPARMQGRAAADLRDLVTAGLRDTRLAYEDAAAYATPQRLCLVVRGLAERQPEPGQLLDLLVGGARQPGPDVQRPLDGVLRGLVAQHRHRGVCLLYTSPSPRD